MDNGQLRNPFGMIEICKKCPKTIGILLKSSRCLHHNCQLSIVNCQFGRSPLNIPYPNFIPIFKPGLRSWVENSVVYSAERRRTPRCLHQSVFQEYRPAVFPGADFGKDTMATPHKCVCGRMAGLAELCGVALGVFFCFRRIGFSREGCPW